MRSSLVAALALVLATASCAEAEPPQLAGDGGADVGVPDGSAPGDADSATNPDDGVGDSAPADTLVDDASTDTGGDTGAGDTGPVDTGADTAPPLDGSAGCHPVVNEVMVAGASAGDEFVELYNPCASPVALSGYSLVYRSATGTSDVPLTDLSSHTLPAGGYLLFAGSGCTVCGSPDGTFGGATGALGGAGGGVAIKNGSLVVDSVGYGTATNAFVEGSAKPAPAASSAIARKPNGVDTGDNSADFVDQAPTPRAAN